MNPATLTEHFAYLARRYVECLIVVCFPFVLLTECKSVPLEEEEGGAIGRTSLVRSSQPDRHNR